MTEYKPDFLHWAHREMYGILADNPKWGTFRAIRLLQKRYSDKIIKDPFTHCLACESRSILLEKRFVKRGFCPLYCPIDWGTGDCFCTGSLYSMWKQARALQRWDLTAKYAIQIKNLPLRVDAHRFYNIKESYND